MSSGYLGYMVGQALVFAVLGALLGFPAASKSLGKKLKSPFSFIAFVILWALLAVAFALIGKVPEPFDGVVHIVVSLLAGAGIGIGMLKWKGEKQQHSA